MTKPSPSEQAISWRQRDYVSKFWHSSMGNCFGSSSLEPYSSSKLWFPSLSLPSFWITSFQPPSFHQFVIFLLYFLCSSFDSSKFSFPLTDQPIIGYVSGSNSRGSLESSSYGYKKQEETKEIGKSEYTLSMTIRRKNKIWKQ